MAAKYRTMIATGYIDKENKDYYNCYLIADKNGVYGSVTKSEGESAIFKRGNFSSIIPTPFGNVAVAICYDSKRKHFYDNIKNERIALILFPHGSPADPKAPEKEQEYNDMFCEKYEKAFRVPVVYVNSVGKLEYMKGKMGALMRKKGFTMNGMTKIYCESGTSLICTINEAVGCDLTLSPQSLQKEISFFGNDLIKGNWFFRRFILRSDVKLGLKIYSKNR